MTHTPGPWRVSNNELGYLTFDILADNLGWPNIGIATTVDARFSDPNLGTVALDRDTCNANARLISAAPELFEACEAMVAAFQLDVYRIAAADFGLMGPAEEAKKKAYAAIAKAKGLVAHESAGSASDV